MRIDDSAEDREPKFYVRQMLADFEAKDITEAFRLKAPDMPFGFEFIEQVVFRDVNFGEPTKPGLAYAVAGQQSLGPDSSSANTVDKFNERRAMPASASRRSFTPLTARNEAVTIRATSSTACTSIANLRRKRCGSWCPIPGRVLMRLRSSRSWLRYELG